MPSTPLQAVSTSWPSAARIRVTSLRMPSSSSTASTTAILRSSPLKVGKEPKRYDHDDRVERNSYVVEAAPAPDDLVHIRHQVEHTRDRQEQEEPPAVKKAMQSHDDSPAIRTSCWACRRASAVVFC